MSALDDVNLQLVLTLDEAMEFKRWLGTRHANNAIAVDTETTGLDPRDPGAAIRLIQFGDTTHGWAIPWQDWRGLALEALNAWDGDWVYHNVAFERRWLECHSPYRVDFSRSWDTMIAAHILDPLASGALKTLSRIHVDPRAAAGQRRLDDGMTQNGWSWATVPVTYPHYWMYGSLDATLTALLWDKFRGDLEGAGKYSNVMTLEMAVLDVIGKMEQRGVSVDVEYSEHEYARLIERSDIIKAWGKETHGVALGSPQQVAALLASKGISFANFTATGKPQVDKDLLKLLSNPDAGHSQEIQDIARGTLLLRESTKIANTYFRTFIESNIDNIVRPTIKTLGARTARMSVSGIPFQQLPKKDGLVRGAVVPRSEDNVILSADYSQIEMRIMAHFSNDLELQQAFITADDTGGDFFVEIGKELYDDKDFKKSDPRRGLLKNCVPLTTQILTQRGWLTYDQVIPGDVTIGYDIETGTSQWTEIMDVLVSEDPAPVYKISHNFRSIYCTSDHRWVADNGRGGSRGIPPRFVKAHEIPGSENRMILAAPFDSSGELDISPDEAALLGWVLGDGHIKRSVFTGGKSQAGGRRTGCRVLITQKKSKGVAEIDELLSKLDPGYKKYPVRAHGSYTFVLSPGYSRDLLDRVGIHDKTSYDSWGIALGLSPEARARMSDALDAADGKKRRGADIKFCIVEMAGTPVVELAVALGFLLGKYAKVKSLEPDGKGWQRSTLSIIEHQKPTMTGQRASFEYDHDAPVWCVTTGLGTWTMRQKDERTPMITGNTAYGLAYGAGVTKMAQSAGVPESQMRPVADGLISKYPGIKRFMRGAESEGAMRERMEGQGYVLTPLGRRLPCDEGKSYTLTNYKIQSTAADILKQALVRLDSSEYGEYMILPVHDEVVFDLPRNMVDRGLIEIPEIMQDLTYAVPLLAEAEGGFERWGDKYAD